MAIVLNGSTGITTPDLDSAADISVYGVTVGRGAGAVATNTAVGASALATNSTGSRNTAVGYIALVNTSGAASLGNTGVGYAAAANVNGNYNTAVGDSALDATLGGSYNTAIGADALTSNTTASNNTAVGYQAGYSGTTGVSNCYFGQGAGYTATTGQYNTYVGTSAGNLTTGSNNQFIGNGAGRSVTTGSGNSIIGNYSGNQGGLDIRTASNYIVLSDGDGNPRIYNSGNYTNFGNGAVNQGGSIRLQDTAASGFGPVIIGRTGAIGATADQWFTGSNSAIKGGTTYSTYTVMAGGSGGVNLTSGATAWTSASDERLKDIIEPITDAANKVSTLRAVIGKYKTDEEGTRRPFLIAQDVQAVLPEAVSEGRNSKGDETEYLQVAYTEVIPLLVAAIKEQQAIITALTARIETLEGK